MSEKFTLPTSLQEPMKRLREICSVPGMWDIIVALRGPDSPSERDCLDPATHSAHYAARVDRKMRTGAVIRGLSVGQQAAAKVRTDLTYVTLPPSSEWDHYDRHIVKAAKAMGIEIKIDPSLSIFSAPGKVIEVPAKQSIFAPSASPTLFGVPFSDPKSPMFGVNPASAVAAKGKVLSLMSMDSNLELSSACAKVKADWPEWFGPANPVPPPSVSLTPLTISKGLSTLKKLGVEVKPYHKSTFLKAQQAAHDTLYAEKGINSWGKPTQALVKQNPSWFQPLGTAEKFNVTMEKTVAHASSAPSTPPPPPKLEMAYAPPPPLSDEGMYFEKGGAGYYFLKNTYVKMEAGSGGPYITFKAAKEVGKQLHPDWPWEILPGTWSGYMAQVGDF